MSILRPASPRQMALALTIVRVVLGLAFIMHGGQKLFVFGLAGVTGAFTQMGVPLPGLVGPFIAILEFFGGIALVLGLLSRVIGLLLACDMLGAIVLVHLKNGFFMPQGYELALALGAMALAVAVGGPGAFAIDDAIARRSATAKP